MQLLLLLIYNITKKKQLNVIGADNNYIYITFIFISVVNQNLKLLELTC